MERYLKLAQGQLPLATPGVLYMCPIGYVAVIRHIKLANSTASGREVSLYQGGTTSEFLILPDVAIVAGGWGEFDGTMMVTEGECLYGYSDAAAAITYSIYGMEAEG